MFFERRLKSIISSLAILTILVMLMSLPVHADKNKVLTEEPQNFVNVSDRSHQFDWVNQPEILYQALRNGVIVKFRAHSSVDPMLRKQTELGLRNYYSTKYGVNAETIYGNTEQSNNLAELVQQPSFQLFKLTGLSKDQILELMDDAQVEYVIPNMELTPAQLPSNYPNDPGLAMQSAYWSKIGVFGFWNMALSGIPNQISSHGEVVFFVLDCGTTHQDLTTNLWTDPSSGSHGINLVEGGVDVTDRSNLGHGDAVTGQGFATSGNATALSGMAINRIMHAQVRVYDTGGPTFSKLAEGCSYVKSLTNRYGFKSVVNMSYGYSVNVYPMFRDIFADMPNTVFVVSAGNEAQFLAAGKNSFQDAALDASNGLVAAAVDVNDNFASFSGYGTHSKILAAPGVDVPTLYPFNFVGVANGTSLSAPILGTTAALLMKYRGLSAKDAVALMQQSSDKFPQLQGKAFGRVNINRAMLEAFTPAPPDPPSVMLSSNAYNGFKGQFTSVVLSSHAEGGVAVTYVISWGDDTATETTMSSMPSHQYKKKSKKGQPFQLVVYGTAQYGGQVLSSDKVTASVTITKR